jgi:hypothetical protein
LGGFAYELLILQGNIEMPHRPRRGEATEKMPYAVWEFVFDLGIWARLIIGALAAVAALFVFTPDSIFKLLAVAVIAGSAGTAVFRSLQDRVVASLAQKETADTKAIAAKANAKLTEAMALTATLKAQPQAGAGHAAAHTVDTSHLNRLETLLVEAKGLHESIQA